MRKCTIFNTLTGIVGIGGMIDYAMTAGVNMEPGILGAYIGGTFLVSLVGTVALVSLETMKQNKREKELVEAMRKARGMK